MSVADHHVHESQNRIRPAQDEYVVVRVSADQGVLYPLHVASIRQVSWKSRVAVITAEAKRRFRDTENRLVILGFGRSQGEPLLGKRLRLQLLDLYQNAELNGEKTRCHKHRLCGGVRPVRVSRDQLRFGLVAKRMQRFAQRYTRVGFRKGISGQAHIGYWEPENRLVPRKTGDPRPIRV